MKNKKLQYKHKYKHKWEFDINFYSQFNIKKEEYRFILFGFSWDKDVRWVEILGLTFWWEKYHYNSNGKI